MSLLTECWAALKRKEDAAESHPTAQNSISATSGTAADGHNTAGAREPGQQGSDRAAEEAVDCAGSSTSKTPTKQGACTYLHLRTFAALLL